MLIRLVEEELRMEDYQIIELYFQRSDMAISETDAKYGKYCYAVATNILGDARDSEECVNDTWLKAWNSMPPQRPNYLRMFLARITRNLAIDIFRGKKRQKRGRGEYDLALEELGDVIHDSSNIEEQVEARELEQCIHAFVEKLPERDCNVFLRRYFYFEAVSDIAKRYGIRESHVHGILSRVRGKLREHLQAQGYDV